VLRRTRFDAREADFYEALYTQSRASFGAYVDAGTLLNNYAHIFDLVRRKGDRQQQTADGSGRGPQ
jgi:DNA repair protein RAD16